MTLKAFYFIFRVGSSSSSVGILTTLRIGHFGVRIPVKAKDSSFIKNVQNFLTHRNIDFFEIYKIETVPKKRRTSGIPDHKKTKKFFQVCFYS
jgi:hypothetical protein